MAETVDDLTIQYEEGGEVLVKELTKHVLSKGAWATVMFLYQDLDRTKKTYRAPKISIRRYKKQSGTYRVQSKFTISNEKQAREICAMVETWFAPGGLGKVDGAAEQGDEDGE